MPMLADLAGVGAAVGALWRHVAAMQVYKYNPVILGRRRYLEDRNLGSILQRTK
jgi:hypothetical protein